MDFLAGIRLEVLYKNDFYVESLYPDVLRILLKNDAISRSRMDTTPVTTEAGIAIETADEFVTTNVDVEDIANLQYQKLLNEDYESPATERAMG